MTRGTLAVFTDSPAEGEILLLTSPEFNGDMAPNMEKGKVYGLRLVEVVNSVESFNNLILATLRAFKMDIPEDTETFSLPHCIQKKKLQDGWKAYEEYWEDTWSEEDQDFVPHQIYGDNPWIKYFHYSDFVYCKNLSSSNLIIIDREGKRIELKPGDSTVLSFGREWGTNNG